MRKACFNCHKIYDNIKPICPHCFVVHREQYSREEVFDFLERFLPTKLFQKKTQVFISTKKVIRKINYWKWFFIGIITLGFGYQFYLLTTLKALNDHWYYPHNEYENITFVDMFTSTLLIIFSNFIGIPILQYVRYVKLSRHLQKAPKTSFVNNLTIQGGLIFFLSFIFYILLTGIIAMLVLGIGSVVFGLYFNFNSTFLIIVFFSGAGLVFISLIIVVQVLVKYDKLWQEVFNYHIEWHQKNLFINEQFL